MKTLREILAERYPLHFQRIVEAMFAQPDACDVDVFLDQHWSDRARALPSAFIWGGTPEGHSYWSALSRREGEG